jgi:phosphatidylglycerol---prolipoprotein diacylglyceryl transferase
MGSRTIHPHLFFESLAYLLAFATYLHLRREFGDPIVLPLRWATLAAAVAGAALASKVLYWLEDPRATLQNIHNPAYLLGGKTIVGALIGGLITVELMKRYIGLHTSTGDLYAIPLASGIAVGRIGCFLTGLGDNTYGTATTLPWGVNFGDGIPRHPTQLYESVFLLLLIPLLFRVLERTSPRRDVILSAALPQQSETDAKSKDPYPRGEPGAQEGFLMPDARRLMPAFLPGDAFKLFMISYVSFRILADFIKPYPRIFLGLGWIQWACVMLLLYYSKDLRRYLRQK